jgi:hypothetical protein
MLAPGKQVPELPLPTGLDPLRLQQLPWLLVNHAGKQASGLLLLKGFVLLCLQHYSTDLLDLRPSKQDLEPHCLKLGFPVPATATVAPCNMCWQADPMVSAAHRLGFPKSMVAALGLGNPR